MASIPEAMRVADITPSSPLLHQRWGHLSLRKPPKQSPTAALVHCWRSLLEALVGQSTVQQQQSCKTMTNGKLQPTPCNFSECAEDSMPFAHRLAKQTGQTQKHVTTTVVQQNVHEKHETN